MNMERPPARSKRTANGKIMGRPVGDRGPAPAVIDRSRLKAYFVRLRQPRPVEDPMTGELRRPFGPGVPVYEMREVRRGRPKRQLGEELLRITKAIAGFDLVGFAAGEAGERDPASVKRELRRVRAAIRERDQTGEIKLAKSKTFDG